MAENELMGDLEREELTATLQRLIGVMEMIGVIPSDGSLDIRQQIIRLHEWTLGQAREAGFIDASQVWKNGMSLATTLGRIGYEKRQRGRTRTVVAAATPTAFVIAPETKPAKPNFDMTDKCMVATIPGNLPASAPGREARITATRAEYAAEHAAATQRKNRTLRDGGTTTMLSVDEKAWLNSGLCDHGHAKLSRAECKKLGV